MQGAPGQSCCALSGLPAFQPTSELAPDLRQIRSFRERQTGALGAVDAKSARETLDGLIQALAGHPEIALRIGSGSIEVNNH